MVLAQLDPRPLEIGVSVDTLTPLEQGLQVCMVPTLFSSHAVDTPDDLEKVEKLMRNIND